MMDFVWKPFVETVLRCIWTFSGLQIRHYGWWQWTDQNRHLRLQKSCHRRMMNYQQYKDDVVEQWSTLKTVTMNSRTNREENVVAALGSSRILITSLFWAEKVGFFCVVWGCGALHNMQYEVPCICNIRYCTVDLIRTPSRTPSIVRKSWWK